jgi:hypothetical protein
MAKKSILSSARMGFHNSTIELSKENSGVFEANCIACLCSYTELDADSAPASGVLVIVQ